MMRGCCLIYGPVWVGLLVLSCGERSLGLTVFPDFQLDDDNSWESGVVRHSATDKFQISSSNCTQFSYNKTCCAENEFRCNNGICIDFDRVCNGDKRFGNDCGDMSDEAGCSSTPCSERNDCEHRCKDLPNNSSKCVCNEGYFLSSYYDSVLNRKCMDIDECARGIDHCSQECINIEGGYGCVCRDGYEKVGKSGCKVMDGNATVLYNPFSWIFAYDIVTKTRTPLVRTGKLDVLDYDPSEEMVYWTTKHVLARSYVPGALGGNVTVGHSQLVGGAFQRERFLVEKFAIDPDGGHIYWTMTDPFDEEKSRIMVAKNDGRFVKTLKYKITRIVDIAVDYNRGFIYWISGGSRPAIGSCYMDGSHGGTYQHLWGHNPTALALDMPSGRRLYFFDSNSGGVYFTYPGVYVRVTEVMILTASRAPVSMDVFGDHIYWTTKESGELLRKHKLGTGDIEVLVTNMVRASSIKVVHRLSSGAPSKRVGSLCGGCSHLCLYSPYGYSCQCPDGSENTLLDGEVTCNAEFERPSEQPLVCNCADKATICNTSSPYHQCHCHMACPDGTYIPGEDDADIISSKTTTTILIILTCFIIIALGLLGMYYWKR